MAAIGVAAVAALEKIGRGKDDVRPFIIEILGTQLRSCGIFIAYVIVVFGRLWHYWNNVMTSRPK